MQIKIAGGGFVTEEAKTETINGIEVGVVEGYIASKALEDNAWPDQFVGANVFGESIQQHKSRRSRPIRLLYMHDRRQQIGGFPIDKVREDERGLFGVGHINLAVEKGREVYALARQGAVSDFSIGFSIPSASDMAFVDRDGVEVREIYKARIFEGSLVDEPMNPDAQVTGVKAEDERITIEALAEMTPRELEKALDDAGVFSRTARKAVVRELGGLTKREDSDVLSEALATLRGMTSS